MPWRLPLAAFAGLAAAQGQEFRGTVSAVVTGATGAEVPDAQVRKLLLALRLAGDDGSRRYRLGTIGITAGEAK
jgi:hypothetical protein